MSRNSDQTPCDQRWLLARSFVRGQIAETNQQLRPTDVLAACLNRVSADASELEVLELSFIVHRPATMQGLHMVKLNAVFKFASRIRRRRRRYIPGVAYTATATWALTR